MQISYDHAYLKLRYLLMVTFKLSTDQHTHSISERRPSPGYMCEKGSGYKDQGG